MDAKPAKGRETDFDFNFASFASLREIPLPRSKPEDRTFREGRKARQGERKFLTLRALRSLREIRSSI